MIIEMTLSALFTIVTVATALSLIDSWIRGRAAYVGLRREKALLDAGFVPQVEPGEVRLRRQRRTTVAGAMRGNARRAPMLAMQLGA